MKFIQSPEFIKEPLVSVVIPSYNRTDTIRITIDSIVNQKCNFEFELIIGDDCSTDNARDVLLDYQKRYPDKIILIFHDLNIGLGANWATCVKHCRGKYVANCDNDDYWHNIDKLQIQVEFMKNNPGYGMIHTDYRKHNRATGKITDEMASNSIKTSEPLQLSIMNGNFRCCNATVMYQKEILNKYINLDDYIKYQFTLQDWNTWMILAKYTDFCCLPVSTATFGIETDSITRPVSFQQLEERFRKERGCYKYVCDLFPEDFPYNSEDYDDYSNSSLLNLAFKYKNFAKAKEYSSRLKIRDLKQLCATNKVLFSLFCTLKEIKD